MIIATGKAAQMARKMEELIEISDPNREGIKPLSERHQMVIIGLNEMVQRDRALMILIEKVFETYALSRALNLPLEELACSLKSFFAKIEEEALKEKEKQDEA